jgi:hypothetical protein
MKNRRMVERKMDLEGDKVKRLQRDLRGTR